MANPALENSIFTDQQALASTRSGQGTSQTRSPSGVGYDQPPASATGPALGYHPDMVGWKPISDERAMTYDDVIVKTTIVLSVLTAFAFAGAMLVTRAPSLIYLAALIGLVLGLINAFKSEPSPALILVYAAAEGIFLGGISFVVEAGYSGAVMQALLGTLAVFVGGLIAYSRLGVRISSKTMRFVVMAMIGMLVFSLINMALMLFGGNDSAWGLRTSVEIMGIPLGVFLGFGAIILGAICLISDFQAIDNGVRAGIPARFAWMAAYGLTVTIVWLYVEFLRLIAILNRN